MIILGLLNIADSCQGDPRRAAEVFGSEHGLSDNYVSQIESFIRMQIEVRKRQTPEVELATSPLVTEQNSEHMDESM